MAIDLGKYLQLYFEESAENLCRLEAALRSAEALCAGAAFWHETVRAAHSVKGNSGAFGFEEIAVLAREIEQILLRVERGEVRMDAALQAACLEAVAGLQELVKRRRMGLSGDASLAAAMGACLGACMLEKAAAGG